MDVFLFQVQKYKANRVIQNSFYGVLQFVLPTLLMLGFTPVFINRMGVANYGLWMLATSTLGLMGMAEFGLNTAVAKFVAEYAEQKDAHSLSVVISTALTIYLVLGIGLVVPLYIFSPSLVALINPTDAVSGDQIHDVIQTMSLGFIPLLLQNGAMGVPIGLQRFKIPVFIITSYQVLGYLAALGVVLAGGSVKMVVGSTVAVAWLTAAAGIFISWRMLKPYRLTYVRPRFDKLSRRMLSFSMMSGLSGLGSRMFSFADRLAVGAVLGLDAVAYYSVIASVSSKILQLSGALTSALMPAVSTWVAAGDIKRVRAYFLKATGIILTLNTFLTFAALIVSAPLLRLWMGEDFANHALSSFRVLVAVYALISVNAPAYHIANGLGIPWLNALGSLVGGSLTVVFIFFFGGYWGLLGAAYANMGYLFIFVLILILVIYLYSIDTKR